MRFNIFLVISVLIGSHKLGNAMLITKPVDAVAKIEDLVFFNCSTTDVLKEVRWYHKSQTEQNIIYQAGQITPSYKGRFYVEKNMSTGSFDLVISPVTQDDVGEYICEDGGFEADKHSAHLILVEDGPSCRSNFKATTDFGQHLCVTEPDTLLLSCDVSYLGKHAPHMTWMKDGQNLTTSENSRSGPNTTSILKIRNDQTLSKSSQYNCQIFESSEKRLSCTLDVIKVDPWNISTLDRKIGDEIICPVIYPCNHTWKRFEGDSLSAAQVYKGPNLTIDFPGQYVCEAVCTILAEPCTIKVMDVQVFAITKSGIKKKFLLLLLIVMIPLLVFYIWRKWSRKTSRSTGITDKRSTTQPQSGDIELEPLTKLPAAINIV